MGAPWCGDRAIIREQADDAETAAASLERMEAQLAAGLAALREVRPPFDALYEVLDQEQRKTLDTLFANQSPS